MSFSHILTCCRLLSILSAYYVWYRVLRCNYALFLRHTFQALRNQNILFTKIFQALANSANLTLTPECRAEMQPFTNQVSYAPDEIDQTLISAVEATNNVTIDRQVINAGMIALVFQGTQKDVSGQPVTGQPVIGQPVTGQPVTGQPVTGQPIILKLKRRGITAHLRKGCDDVAVLYSYAAYWYPQNLYVRVLRPFIRNLGDIIEQCDFEHEMQNLREAKADLAELPYIRIPMCISGTQEYILMEKLEGNHLLPEDTPVPTRLAYLDQYCRFTLFCFLANTIQHIDLHAGNILFQPGGLGIIDYGMAFRPSEEMHEIAINTVQTILDPTHLDGLDIARDMRHFFDPPLDVSENIPLVNDILQNIARPLRDNITLDELALTDNLNQLSAVLGREIVLNRDMYKMILGVTMMGFLRTVMGPHTLETAELNAIQRRAMEYTYALVMSA